MREVGSKELKSSLGYYLRRVAAGEEVRVTVRGHHVADLVPPGARSREDDGFDELVAEGKVTPAAEPHGRSAPPLADLGRSASAVVIAERELER
jgi:prevent-host-death family protein